MRIVISGVMKRPFEFEGKPMETEKTSCSDGGKAKAEQILESEEEKKKSKRAGL